MTVVKKQTSSNIREETTWDSRLFPTLMTSAGLPFCCRASCLLVSMSCRVAARFLGRLPVLLVASRGLCQVRMWGMSISFRWYCTVTQKAPSPLRSSCAPVWPHCAAEGTLNLICADEDLNHCPAWSGTPEGGRAQRSGGGSTDACYKMGVSGRNPARISWYC